MFVGLHRHSHYSRRDAIAKIPDIVSRTAELGQTAWALTDHGTTSGLLEGYRETQNYNHAHGANLKFIFGIEAYWIPDFYLKDRKQSRHILILAKNQAGYRNLLKLTTAGFGNCGKNPDAFFYTMRVTTQLLEQFREGLIVTTACRGGILNVERDGLFGDSLVYERLRELKRIFGEDFFLEVQSATDADQVAFNKRVSKLSRELEIPIIATEDSHYVFRDDAPTHRKWLQLDDESNYYSTPDYFIHSENEVLESIAYLPESLECVRNTSKIDSQIECVEIPFEGKNFPQIESYEEKLQIDISKGFKEKIVDTGIDDPRYFEQLEHELEVLRQCDYLSYFAMTADFIRWARERGIQVGRGRGSVGGSLVAFLLDITRIDPLKFGLVFERFAHTERVSLPDIDVDVPNARRQEIISYLQEKYGEVFHVRTFGTMADKAAIQRAARALGKSPDEIRELGKNHESVDKLPDGELKSLSTRFRGVIQNYGCHASAIMLFPGDPTDFCAIEKQGDDYVCAYEYPDLERMGLLKMDVLGIKTLDAIDECLRLVKKNHGIDVDIDSLPFDDAKTFEMLSRGDTIACFQVESEGMKKLLRQIKPGSLFDLIPLVALYRPATIKSGMVDEFLSRRKGEKFEYLHPLLEPILNETYGVLLYQEQAMRIVQAVTGYTLGRADMFRKAIGKKDVAKMDSLIEQFIRDGESRGIDSSTMNKLAEWLKNCAGYQFNKSHAAAYALVCFQTAYLKANFPAEYLTAYLNAYHDSKQEELLPYVNYAKSIGIPILPPDARSDKSGWILRDGKIQIAINFIRGVGDIPLPVDAQNLHKLNRDKIVALIKSGALDFLGDREGMLQDISDSVGKNQTKGRSDAHRQQIFSSTTKSLNENQKSIVGDFRGEYDESKFELEVLGMSFENVFKDFDVGRYSEPADDDETRLVLCVVRNFKQWKQKNGKPMAFLRIEVPSGKNFEVVMFNNSYTPLELNRPYVLSTVKDKLVRVLP